MIDVLTYIGFALVFSMMILLLIVILTVIMSKMNKLVRNVYWMSYVMFVGNFVLLKRYIKTKKKYNKSWRRNWLTPREYFDFINYKTKEKDVVNKR